MKLKTKVILVVLGISIIVALSSYFLEFPIGFFIALILFAYSISILFQANKKSTKVSEILIDGLDIISWI